MRCVAFVWWHVLNLNILSVSTFLVSSDVSSCGKSILNLMLCGIMYSSSGFLVGNLSLLSRFMLFDMLKETCFSCVIQHGLYFLRKMIIFSVTYILS